MSLDDQANPAPIRRSVALEARWASLGRYLDYLEIRLWARRWLTIAPDAVAVIYTEPDFVSEFMAMDPDYGAQELWSRVLRADGSDTNNYSNGQVLTAAETVVEYSCPENPRVSRNYRDSYLAGFDSTDMPDEELLHKLGWPAYLTRTDEEIARDTIIESDMGEIDAYVDTSYYRSRVLSEVEIFIFLAGKDIADTYAGWHAVPIGFELSDEASEQDITDSMREVAHELVLTANELRRVATVELSNEVREEHPTATDLRCGIVVWRGKGSDGNPYEELDRENGPITTELLDDAGTSLVTYGQLDKVGDKVMIWYQLDEDLRSGFSAKWLSPWIQTAVALDNLPIGPHSHVGLPLKIFTVNLRPSAIAARSRNVQYCDYSPW